MTTDDQRARADQSSLGSASALPVSDSAPPTRVRKASEQRIRQHSQGRSEASAMLWVEIDSVREQAQKLTDTVATVIQNVSTISGAIQALAANDNAHLQRLDQLTTDVREIRARLDQQVLKQTERIGQATADAVRGDLANERQQSQRVIQIRSDIQSWVMYATAAGLGALLTHLLAH